MVSVYLSALSFTSQRLLSPSLCALPPSLLTPAPGSQTMGVWDLRPLSPTLIPSLIRRGIPYTSSSPFVLSEHSLKDLVLRHCNSLFLMFLMRITRHPGGLFISPFSRFRASSPSLLLRLCALSTCLKTDAEIQPCRFDLMHFEPPIYITCF